ncbi:hypothetical protein [Streptomyces himalayensis]|nr:hypothetical protein [Streptomyces himalayensis]
MRATASAAPKRSSMRPCRSLPLPLVDGGEAEPHRVTEPQP